MTNQVEPLRIRQSARVVLLNPADEVLLVRVEDTAIRNPSQEVPETFWITLGGGLEDEESFEDAVRREVFEETGISAIALGPQLFEREMEIEMRGEMVLARERYFVARVGESAVVFDNVTDAEREVFREHRWWSAGDVVSEDHEETLLPPQLPKLLEQAITFQPR